jgi:hypothetical protein
LKDLQDDNDTKDQVVPFFLAVLEVLGVLGVGEVNP